jgi:glycerol-3-phosphate dehydrogenase
VTIAGGKLTAYRRMAERVVETVAPLLGRKLPASPSAQQCLPGGDLAGARDVDAYASLPSVRTALATAPADAAARLLATFGSEALDVVATVGAPEALRSLTSDVPLSSAEVRYAIRHEMACTLADLLERRSRLALFCTAAARTVAPMVAEIAAQELGWDATRTDRELASFERQCEARLDWRNPSDQRKENR